MTSWSVRRVDYRRGTNEDLAKVWRCEAEVEAERRPDNAAPPVDQFIADARSFPAYFHEWTWLAEDPDGTALATAACWYREGADPRWLDFDIWVRPQWRRQGIGSEMVRLVCAVAADEGREMLHTSTTDQAPSGEGFARWLGMTEAIVGRRSEVRLDDVDWDMVQAWIDDGPRRAPGYRLELVRGAYPEEHWDDVVAQRTIMNTAPIDDLDIADRVYTREQVPQDDAWILDGGKQRWTYFARHVESGECVGGTVVYWAPWDPAVINQGDTGVHPDHRGHALGKWLKAAMLATIRAERPEATAVRTGNAFSNAPMLGINDALGFKVIRVTTDWQAPLEPVTTRVGS